MIITEENYFIDSSAEGINPFCQFDRYFSAKKILFIDPSEEGFDQNLIRISSSAMILL